MRFARSFVLALTLLAVTAGGTLAHECYVANRGATGTQQAGTNSQSWIYVTLPALAGFLSNPTSPDALPALSSNQLAYFVQRAQQLGVPAEFAIFVGGRPHEGGLTIGANDGFTKNGRGTDGTGVDHFFSAYAAQVMQAYMEALARPA